MNNSPFQLFLTNNSPRSARAVFRGLLILTLCFAFLAGSVHSASAYDLTKVKNASFEKDTNGDGIPNAWTPTDLSAADKRVCNQSYAGSCSYRMVGDGIGKYLYQETLYSSGPAGIVATLSVWAKGNAIDLGGGYARLILTFNWTGGGSNGCYINIPAGSSPWTFREVSCDADQAFDVMSIYLETDADSGKMWFDKVKLVAAPP